VAKFIGDCQTSNREIYKRKSIIIGSCNSIYNVKMYKQYIQFNKFILERYIMQKFGNADDLPKVIEEKVNGIITKIESLDLNNSISIYYGYPFIELDGKETIMKSCIISKKGIISIYSEEKEKDIYIRHLTKLLLESPELSSVYFNNPGLVLHNVDIDSIEDIIAIMKDGKDYFSENNYRMANAIIQNMYGLNHTDDRDLRNESTLGALIKKRNNEINMLDQNQFETIYKKTVAHTRIRGLAGSGKTILLVKKMAYMHYKQRDLELVYVFYTKSLKQYIKDLFISFYKDFEKYKDPDMDRIHILHSWGGAEMEGFYSKVCNENGIIRQGYSDVSGANKFDHVCKNLLEVLGAKSKLLYDYVFIDEAQDFSLYFFKLVLSTLKTNGKMIYAYDELQSLNANTESMPSKRSIFGEDICEDINLSICYRTPRDIIVAAHALGLGIYRRNKQGEIQIINMMQDYSIWSAIGYEELAGKLGYGEKVVLGRKEVIVQRPDECVKIIDLDDEIKQYDAISEELCDLIKNEDVLPEDILIIDLAAIKFQDNYSLFRQAFAKKMSDRNEVLSKIHLVNKDNALKFKRIGSIPYTTIFRAKGNEANIVFILNAQTMSSMQTYSRNRLFTAMTRSKFKVYVYGVTSDAMGTLKDEYEEIVKKEFALDFRYPTQPELTKMKTIVQSEAKSADTYEKAYKNLKDNKALTIEILKEQVGAGSIEELIGKLKEYNENGKK